MWSTPLVGCGSDTSGVGPQRTDTATTVGVLFPDASERLGPPYPVVLAHGFFGFDDFAGLDFIQYYYGVKAHLEELGEPDVFTPAVDPFNNSTVRGLALLARIEAILQATGHARVNIVAHSQGGLDARFAAHMRPDLIASITTVATPHHGTQIADIALGLIDNDSLGNIIDGLTKLIGAALWDELGQETSVVESLRQLSTPAMDAFNAQFTDSPDVAYFSIAARSDHHFGTVDCAVDNSPEFIARWRQQTDPIDPLLAVTEAVLDANLGPGIANDGLVRVRDSRWGTFLGCIPADHLDEVGHLFGDLPGLFNRFDHLVFYGQLVAWLRAQGH